MLPLLLLLSQAAQAARLAVVIGISQYKNPDIPDLSYGAADAEAIAAVLQDREHFDHVTLLTDAAATRAAVLTALAEDLSREAGPQDDVVVFYSGHGASEQDLSGEEPDGYRKFLVPVDADPDNLLATAIDMRDILRYLGWTSARSVLGLFDSCYSGGLGARGLPLPGGTRSLARSPLPAPQGSGRALLLGAQANQLSIELDSLGHGLFTAKVLDGLAGAADANHDGAVTATELNSYVHDAVMQAAAAAKFKQEPSFVGSFNGDLILTHVQGASRSDAAAEQARLAQERAALQEREAALARQRELGAQAFALARDTEASASASPEDRIARWEEFIAGYPDDPEVATARERLTWLRSANKTFLDVDANLDAVDLILDGQRVGTGPRTLTEVSLGRHRLVVQKHGYHPWQQEVTVPAGGLKVKATLSPAFGTLSVASDPPGASVWIGEVRVGQTPMVLPELSSGPVQVQLRLDRYDPLSTVVEVRDGQTTELHPALVADFGELVLTGAPQGATITVNGRRAGEAPLGPQIVDPGPVDVVVSAAHRLPWTGHGVITRGQTLSLAVPALDVQKGSLSLISEPRGAEVLLDGARVGTTPLTLDDLPAGAHQVELHASGLGWSGAVQVEPGRVNSLQATLHTLYPGMIHVEAGAFEAGAPPRPAKTGAFYIDRTEVSNRAWAQCVAARACPATRGSPAAELPVVNVTWRAASAYCAWRGGRLPTELEWERAARGTDGRAYPWGDTYDPRKANGNDQGRVDGFAQLSSVESFLDGASPTGALNMSGNALEWTSTPFGAGYAVRGGGALMEGGPEGLKTTSRFAVPAEAVSEDIGFRCAADD